ncbi:MAG: sulfite exporter TauE/SafE family protein, partial [Campylobacteraceae bacterium]|nr:sulfite exporter TauE/SafE family protein [Campylobacteraceae bacterium]
MDLLSFATIISVAFFGSLGHCIGMCGGFVIAYTSVKIDPKTTIFSQLLAHFVYNLGRVSSYI